MYNCQHSRALRLHSANYIDTIKDCIVSNQSYDIRQETSFYMSLFNFITCIKRIHSQRIVRLRRLLYVYATHDRMNNRVKQSTRYQWLTFACPQRKLMYRHLFQLLPLVKFHPDRCIASNAAAIATVPLDKQTP